jgi:hypothetical protein
MAPADQAGGGAPEGDGDGQADQTPDGVRVIASPTGVGKTTAAAEYVAERGSAVWLTERHEDVDAAVAVIERAGGKVGRVVPLQGETGGVPNCLHPDDVNTWQSKGYAYRAGFCAYEDCCERKGDPGQCPYLASVDALEEASTIAVTKALARTAGFFGGKGNPRRSLVVIDEDPIGLLRPDVTISREDLAKYVKTLGAVRKVYEKENDIPALAVANHYATVAGWLLEQVARQKPGEPDDPTEAVDVPADKVKVRSGLPEKALGEGQKRLDKDFRRLMRRDPDGTVRNVTRDLRDLTRAAGRVVYVTCSEVLFHVKVNIPKNKEVLVLDATANADLLRPVFAPRSVEVLCDEPVEPQGRVLQFMDFNGPRSYLNKAPTKVVRIIDAIGDRHPEGTIVLISHKSCVEELKKKSRHTRRIRTAYFGALRGRNDLEDGPDNRVACHIVAGSPKTTEGDRQKLALAVYGRSILPFAPLVTVRRGLWGNVPAELLEEGDAPYLLWEVRLKGYDDPRMQAVYDHTVTAELTHAADRARVLIHESATVYLVTNEPCPRLWFAEQCFAADCLDLTDERRADFQKNYTAYEAKAVELLNKGGLISNTDVCKAMDRKPSAGFRYWCAFKEKYRDALTGTRKVRWKGD